MKNSHKTNIRSWRWLASTGIKSTSDSIISPFLPLYGIELGASSTQIGLLVSITSLLSILQIAWARLADKIKNARIIAIVSNHISSLFNFLYAILRNLASFIVFRGFQSIISSASVPTTSVILTERTPTKDWPYWNSLIQAFMVVGTLIGVLLGGILLSYFTGEMGYILLFVAAGFLSLISSILFHLAVPKREKLVSRKRWHKIEEVSVSLDNILAIMKTDRNFIWLSLANFIFVFGVNFSAPFYIVFNIEDYSLSILQTALLTSIGLVPQIISSILSAKVIEKLRTKEVLIMGGLITSLFPIAFFIPFITGATNNIYPILISMWIINGIAWGIINTSLSTLTLDVIHPRRRTIQIAINNSLSAIALFLAPVLGGLVIQRSTIFYLVFLISSIGRFVGSILFIKVKEPVIGGTILRPISKIIITPIRVNIEKIVHTMSTIQERQRVRTNKK